MDIGKKMNGGGKMMVVIECRQPNGIFTDLVFCEPEHVVRKSLMEYKEEYYYDFNVVYYTEDFGVQFRDFVEELNEETEYEPKPCPQCGSNNVEVDADGMSTSLTGIDYQNIWVECGDCEFKHTINVCDYPFERRPSQLCIKQWNEIPEDSGNPKEQI